VIAALFVQANGAYFGLEDVDPWPESRDARTYPGPHPVVAHPPCSRWCRLAGLVEARWGHKRGDDGGCFASALDSVRRWGGVLEHPAYSDAWADHGLLHPPTGGGWVNADFVGGWTCYVEQHGVELPALRWGHVPGQKAAALVSWCGNRVASGEDRPRLGKKAASATPPEFRAELLSMARSVERRVA
jgi:hypothetical protein